MIFIFLNEKLSKLDIYQYTGCQDGDVLDDLKEQLNQVNTKITQLNENLVKEKTTEEPLPEKEIGNKTTHEGNTLQTDLH